MPLTGEDLQAMRAMMQEELEPINTRLDKLEQGQKNLEKSVINLEDGQRNLEKSVIKLEDSQRNLENSVIRLEDGQRNLENGQKNLEKSVIKLEDGQRNLEQSQEELTKGQLAIRADIARVNHTLEPKINAVYEGLSGILRRNEQTDQHEMRLEDHDHRIFALEQVVRK